MEIITISGQNIDANGTWTRTEIEKELNELGYTNISWIEYVLSHAIETLDQKAINGLVMLMDCDSVDVCKLQTRVDGLQINIEFNRT